MKAEQAFEKWNASPASDKFEADSIETYTAFLAGFNAARLPWHKPSEELEDGQRIVGITGGKIRFGPPSNSKGQHTGNYTVHYDLMDAWIYESDLTADFEASLQPFPDR